ncbi:phage integrase N-terminal domain-containing protein [Pseudomonas aeruginosa]|uniref:phage integrase N-terminal domain-containing protein n=1 Tax=Pseudomonas aeruginosa TaxID=287 RepID=UPI003EDED1B9
MDKLEKDWLETQKHNRDCSSATQAVRRVTLGLSARQLRELGYRNLRADRIDQEHLHALVAKWKNDGIHSATIRSRVALLRWACMKIGHSAIAGVTATDLGIEKRSPRQASNVTVEALEQVHDRYTQFSLCLQAEFGLKRQESIKFRVAEADKGNGFIVLHASWVLGGRSRTIPIRTLEQRALLRKLHDFCSTSSLIPSHLSYSQQLKHYKNQIRAAGLHTIHGLRQLYVQTRYYQLTGKQPPAAQHTLSSHALSCNGENKWFAQLLRSYSRHLENAPQAGLSDREALQILTEELGHLRTSDMSFYLGLPLEQVGISAPGFEWNEPEHCDDLASDIH